LTHNNAAPSGETHDTRATEQSAILSGLLQDCSLGARAIKEAGGVVLVQSPAEAAYPEMPESAIRYDAPVDLVGPIDALAGEIAA